MNKFEQEDDKLLSLVHKTPEFTQEVDLGEIQQEYYEVLKRHIMAAFKGAHEAFTLTQSAEHIELGMHLKLAVGRVDHLKAKGYKDKGVSEAKANELISQLVDHDQYNEIYVATMFIDVLNSNVVIFLINFTRKQYTQVVDLNQPTPIKQGFTLGKFERGFMYVSQSETLLCVKNENYFGFAPKDDMYHRTVHIINSIQSIIKYNLKAHFENLKVNHIEYLLRESYRLLKERSEIADFDVDDFVGDLAFQSEVKLNQEEADFLSEKLKEKLDDTKHYDLDIDAIKDNQKALLRKIRVDDKIVIDLSKSKRALEYYTDEEGDKYYRVYFDKTEIV